MMIVPDIAGALEKLREPVNRLSVYPKILPRQGEVAPKASEGAGGGEPA
jgi:hypothetical protein